MKIVFSPLRRLKCKHHCLDIHMTPQITSQRRDENDPSSFTALHICLGCCVCVCIFNWSVYNVMNLYKAISQNEYLSAFPPRSHLPLIFHISLQSASTTLTFRALTGKQWGLLGILNLTEYEYETMLWGLWCLDVHNYTAQGFSLRGAPLSANCSYFWHPCSIQGALVSSYPHTLCEKLKDTVCAFNAMSLKNKAVVIVQFYCYQNPWKDPNQKSI